MESMPDYAWYILAGIVFVVATVILRLHQRRCKAKGIKPQPPFERFKRHEKRISKWLDIYIIAFILLSAVFYGSTLYMINSTPAPDIPPEYTQTNARLAWSVNFMLSFTSLAMVVVMVSFLSPFHKDITFKKRLILIGMCCVPLVFGILYCIFDDTQNYRFYIKLLLGGLFPVVFINWPAILLGKPFVEFFPRLCRKIPLPWFQIPEQEETKSERAPKGQK
jgi:magnesium-transporting ATPase (P-type)